MSEQTWYYIDESQAQYGPITIPDLQALAKAGIITPETQLWTEVLGEQWIPAANVEDLFPPKPATMAPILRTPTLQTSTLRTPTPVISSQEAETYPQPSLAATTPMIPSTPTTQPVRGVPVPNQLAAQTASANPYQSPVEDPQQLSDGMYPATIKKGGSMGLWSFLFFGGFLSIILGIMAPEILTSGEKPIANESSKTIVLALIFLGYACLLFSGILNCIYLYRAWKCLQPGGATVSPGKAIGFLFIPFFNIYWIFIAFGGLPRQWNTITSSFPNTKNAPRLSIGAFVCMLLIPIIGQIIWLSQITRGLNFMAGLHLQQSRPTGSALAALGSRAHFK
jgi:hypothetical protein